MILTRYNEKRGIFKHKAATGMVLCNMSALKLSDFIVVTPGRYNYGYLIKSTHC